ncbi:helix-turn-helix domain-containing protein [Vagococcus fluvialis]|uniref:Mga-like protein with HTH domain n=1 Tax=Vagococcus fluvialis TaxID=2738 RepID=A0A7X6D9R0_9ENTE|nr:helix-turn-helix domain-containing protein [Vagococcus fluvialis]NKC68407.1 hypothetical protein [Vagococcus fluvialis]
MDNLIETTIKRQILILETLYLNRTGIDLSELSILLSCSENTILRDIKYFNKNFEQKIFIKKDNKKKIYLISKSIKNIRFVAYSILNNSLNINITKTILLTPYKNIEYYASFMNTSVSSIYKSIKLINSALSDYQVKIESRSGIYFFIAKSEIILRKIFTIFWLEINLFNNDLIDPDNHTELMLYWKNRQKKSILNNKYAISYYLAFNFISSLRVKQKFYINNNIDKNEVTIEYINKSLFCSILDNHLINIPIFYKLSDFLKNEVFQKNCDFSELFYLIKIIYENKIFYQIPLYLFIDPTFFFHHQLSNNKFLYNHVTEIIKQIETIIKIDIADYYSAISYVLLVYYKKKLKIYKNKDKTIYIFSFLSEEHANFLKFQLENYFDTDLNFVITTYEQIPILNTNDVLITNSPLIERENTLIVSDYISELEFTNIKNKISLN